MDASSEAFKSIDAQVLQLQHIARLVYDYVPSPNFSFAGGIYVLGQDGLVQSNMNTFEKPTGRESCYRRYHQGYYRTNQQAQFLGRHNVNILYRKQQ
ncbi:unnamed protein product, partial [Mesorhabditis spiculigera]